jgi:hypothetical protein
MWELLWQLNLNLLKHFWAQALFWSCSCVIRIFETSKSRKIGNFYTGNKTKCLLKGGGGLRVDVDDKPPALENLFLIGFTNIDIWECKAFSNSVAQLVVSTDSYSQCPLFKHVRSCSSLFVKHQIINFIGSNESELGTQMLWRLLRATPVWALGNQSSRAALIDWLIEKCCQLPRL